MNDVKVPRRNGLALSSSSNNRQDPFCHPDTEHGRYVQDELGLRLYQTQIKIQKCALYKWNTLTVTPVILS